MSIYRIALNGVTVGTVHEIGMRQALYAAHNLVAFNNDDEVLTVFKEDDSLSPEVEAIVHKYQKWLEEWDLPVETQKGVDLLNEANALGYTMEYKRMTYDIHGMNVAGYVKARKIR